MKNLFLDEVIQTKISQWLDENRKTLIDINKTCIHEITLTDDEGYYYKFQLKIRVWDGDYDR